MIKKNKDTIEITNFNDVFEFFRKNDSQIECFGKTLGKGAYSEVREVKLKNSMKMMAAKLIKNDNENINSNEIEIAKDLRGNNIIKMNKTISREFNGEDYTLIIMEKAILRDLGKLTEFYYKHNLLKLIFEGHFDQRIGENFLRFSAKHFDIKPKNLLISNNLNKKLADFGLSTKGRNEDKISIPDGTQGYLTEEYLVEEKNTAEVEKKQDYFVLGLILYYLKFDEPLLECRKIGEPILDKEINIQKIIRKMNFIKSRQEISQEFIDFLISLLHYDPDQRLSFEQIYRNKWLNTNRDEIEFIINSNENDEEKLIMELQKSDYLINKEKEISKPKENFRFKKKKKYF